MTPTFNLGELNNMIRHEVIVDLKTVSAIMAYQVLGEWNP